MSGEARARGDEGQEFDHHLRVMCELSRDGCRINTQFIAYKAEQRAIPAGACWVSVLVETSQDAHTGGKAPAAGQGRGLETSELVASCRSGRVFGGDRWRPRCSGA